MRALKHRDFRILWIGALLSFTGSWIQNVAQQWLVFDLTHSEARLGLVAFCSSAPVAVLGPIAGAMVDKFDKKLTLILTQAVFALAAGALGVATYFHFVQYWHVLIVAAVFGITGSFEMPTRQSVVGRAVPPEDLQSAVPLQAMTFNLARIVGPAIGALILVASGPAFCYFANMASFLALIFAAMAIRANLKPGEQSGEPVRDLLIEGLRFTFFDVRLRTLFIMEAIVSAFGLAYLAIMAAIVQEMLHLDKRGIGWAMSIIGVGAICGLLIVTRLGSGKLRGRVVRGAMIVFGLALATIGFFPYPAVALPLFGLLGMCSIMQFNTTNTLFQLIAPDRLRGRVIAMHVWALSGIGPFGTLFLTWLASQTSIAFMMQVGGLVVLVGAMWGRSQRRAFQDMP